MFKLEIKMNPPEEHKEIDLGYWNYPFENMDEDRAEAVLSGKCGGCLLPKHTGSCQPMIRAALMHKQTLITVYNLEVRGEDDEYDLTQTLCTLEKYLSKNFI